MPFASFRRTMPPASHWGSRLGWRRIGRDSRESSVVGKVAFIAVQSQPETGNVAVKVRFPNPDLRLRANVVVRVHVLTKPEKERLTIPEAALMEDLNRPLSWWSRTSRTRRKEGGRKASARRSKLQVDPRRPRPRTPRRRNPRSGRPGEERERSPPKIVLFVTEGGHGLHNDDSRRELRKKKSTKEDEQEKTHEGIE